MGVEEMQTEIRIVLDEALELADALAERVGAEFGDGLGALEIARDYQEKRRYIRRLRRALKVEVGG